MAKDKIPFGSQLFDKLAVLKDKFKPKEEVQAVHIKQQTTQKIYKNDPRPKHKRTQRYIPPKKIDYYSNEPPTIIRTYVSEPDKKDVVPTPKTNSTEVDVTPEIAKFPDPPIEFPWIKNKSKIKYKLDFSKGLQFQPTRYSDKEDREITIGFDFGTSSSKITIRDRQDKKSFAIPFNESDDIQAFLLPSKIYLHGDHFSFDTDGREFNNLKINAITSKPNEQDLIAVVAYMALVIRHARTEFFKNYDSNYRGQRFLWRLNVGIPARNVQKFEIKDRYLNLARAALISSYGEDSFINIKDIKKSLDLISGDRIDKEFKNLPGEFQIAFDRNSINFMQEGVGLYPEIMAQIHGFVHSNEWNPESNPHIMMIDIGAGTVDLSLCDVVENDDGEFNYFPLACMVEGLGVSNLVRHRMNSILEATENLNDMKQSLILKTLIHLDDVNYGEIHVPSDFKEMMEDFLFKNEDAFCKIDKIFTNLLGKCIWTETTLKALSGSKEDDTSWKPFPVFVCGGGSRMPFYYDYISHFEKMEGYKAQFLIRTVPQPPDLFNVEAGQDYDRLSVSYGLSFWELGNFIADFERPKIKTDGDDSLKWTNNFISKDMI